MAKIDRVQEVSLELLRPYEKNAKIHTPEQVEKIANSIREFGFLSPVLIDKDFGIIRGHGRVLRAQKRCSREHESTRQGHIWQRFAFIRKSSSSQMGAQRKRTRNR